VDPDPGATIAAPVRTLTRRRFLGGYIDPERTAHHGARALPDRLGCRVVRTCLAITIEAHR
ncbi:MAG: hypothetical protein WB471_15295, partial [Nocardioides sp.]